MLSKNISKSGIEFVERALAYPPECRLTAREALGLEWLAGLDIGEHRAGPAFPERPASPGGEVANGDFRDRLDRSPAFAGQVKSLGKGRPDTLSTVQGMANVFQGQGKYGGALEWYWPELAQPSVPPPPPQSPPHTDDAGRGRSSRGHARMRYILWCIELELGPTVVKTICVVEGDNDQKVFNNLRRVYYETRGWWRAKMSLWVLTQIRYVKV